MRIYTKQEYDELVERLSNEVYDPMLDGAEFGLDDVIEYAEDDNLDGFRDAVYDEVESTVLFDLEPDTSALAFDDSSPVLLASIVQHAEAYRVKTPFQWEPRTTRDGKLNKPDVALKNTAPQLLMTDVTNHVFSRVRETAADELEKVSA